MSLRFALVAAIFVLAAISPAGAQETPLAAGEHWLDVNGTRLWYRVAGRADGVPAIFLHGGPGQGSRAFAATGGAALELTTRLIYLDQRGAGRSQRPREAASYSIDLMVNDIEALRRHLGVARVALVGHSFGTVLALEYAARFPQHVTRVVLAAAVPDWPRQTDILCQRIAAADPMAYGRATAGIASGATPRCNIFAAYPGGLRDFVYRNMFPDPATGARVDALDSADGLGNTGESTQALFGQGLLRYRFAHADRVTAPVLIIAGGRDYQAVIEAQRALAQALPHGRLLEYPDNGHFMFVEEPRRFARDVNGFLSATR